MLRRDFIKGAAAAIAAMALPLGWEPPATAKVAALGGSRRLVSEYIVDKDCWMHGLVERMPDGNDYYVCELIEDEHPSKEVMAVLDAAMDRARARFS